MSLLDLFFRGRSEPAPAPRRAIEPVPVKLPDGPVCVEVVGVPAADEEKGIPAGVSIAAGWSWRLLLFAAVLIGVGYVLSYFSEVSIPIAIAILLTAALFPFTSLLRKWGVKPLFAAILGLLALALFVAGILALVGTQIASELPQLGDQAVKAAQSFLDWLATGPLHISQSQINEWTKQLTDYVSAQRAELAKTAAAIGTRIGHFFAGAAVAIIATFFFLYQGREIWTSVMRVILPKRAEPATDLAARKGWTSLVAYMRAQVIVAFIDAAGVLIGALALGIPLPFALFALTFLTAFIPVVGAVLSGVVAVALALLTYGWFKAVIMLAIVVAVMQIEGHFLQPLVMGKAVEVHPLLVLLGIVVGATVAGLVGALLAIPTIAFLSAFIRALSRGAEDLPTDLRATLSQPRE